MPVILALLASLAFGTGDFLGGVATRRLPVALTTLLSHLAAFAILIPGVALLPGAPSPAALLWGAVGGVCGGAGLLAFYQGLATGRMSLVSPLAAVLGAGVPVAVGAGLGQRPSPVAGLGMAAGVVAIALISLTRNGPGEGSSRTSIALGAAAGLGFGLFFCALDRAPAESGLWPLVGARVTTATLFAALVLVTVRVRHPDRRAMAQAVVAGLLDLGANTLFLLAVRRGQLGLVAVLASLYPAVTVTLSMVILGERPRRSQAAGIGLALLAVSLIAIPTT